MWHHLYIKHSGLIYILRTVKNKDTDLTQQSVILYKQDKAI
jgi:hypothetical protein